MCLHVILIICNLEGVNHYITTLLLLCSGLHIDLSGQCTHPDYDALISIYDAMNGPNWQNNAGWDDLLAPGVECDPCSWQNVFCTNNRVSYLNFSESASNFIGHFPDVELPHLEGLFVLGGHFQVKMPSFNKCPLLNTLTLSSCVYDFDITQELNSNTITSFTYLAHDEQEMSVFPFLPQLKSFTYGSSSVSAVAIPENLAYEKLEYLQISDSNIASVPNFKGLPNLIELSIQLSWVRYTGDPALLPEINIPDFNNLPNLETFSYTSNIKTQNNIPAFQFLSNLKSLNLAFNNLTGDSPNLQNLPNLRSLNLSHNELSGPLPNFEFNPELEVLRANHNQFTGTIPDSYSDLENLIILIIGENNLSGCFPDFICDIGFYGEGNDLMIHGGHHQAFCSEPNFNQVGAYCGRLDSIENGVIQEDCSCLFVECDNDDPQLIELLKFYETTDGDDWTRHDIWREADKGVVCDPCLRHPVFGRWFGVNCDEDGNIVSIDMDGLHDGLLLNLQGNNLSGTLPELNLPQLKTLILTGNELSGPLPDLNTYPNLEQLGVAFNQFTGPLPDFSTVPKLRNFRGSYNQFSGNLDKLADLDEIEIFTASNNKLEGCYPENICDINLVSLIDNFSLPWQGNYVNFCLGEQEVGAPCKDANGNTGVIDMECNCAISSSTINLEEELILLYPNPARDELNIRHSNYYKNYEIKDLSGRTILNGALSDDFIQTHILSSGIYILVLYNERGNKTTSRFIKS